MKIFAHQGKVYETVKNIEVTQEDKHDAWWETTKNWY